MTAIIVEDNISFSWDYEMILDELGVKVLGVYKTWQEAFKNIKTQSPDFAIVDIFLDENQNGFEFAKLLKELFIPFVICTGYPKEEFLEKAFTLGSKAFFSKPLDKAAFKFEIKKLIKEIGKLKKNPLAFYLKTPQRMIRIPCDQIIQVKTEGNYSTLFLVSGKRHVVKKSLRKVMKELDFPSFIQSHRSCLINLDHASEIRISKNEIQLSNNLIAPLGENYKLNLIDKYKQH